MSEHAELAVIESDGHGVGAITLFGTTDPLAVLDRAGRVAAALAKVINQQKLFAVIQGKKYVTVEGWTLLGSMLGVFPQIEWTRRIVAGSADYSKDGWEARAIAVVAASGITIGAGEAMCTRQESSWRSRDDYALRAMAQTRAISRALRGPLDFVVKLAGYASTPAEEMPQDRAGAAPPATPASSIAPSPAPTKTAEAILEEARLKLAKPAGGIK